MMDDMSLGPCCICEVENGVNSIVMLDRKCVVPGHGWGCVVCNLPSDGASAVLCDKCAELYGTLGDQALKFVCRGYPASDGRIAFESAAPDGSHKHDRAKHPGEDWL